MTRLPKLTDMAHIVPYTYGIRWMKLLSKSRLALQILVIVNGIVFLGAIAMALMMVWRGVMLDTWQAEPEKALMGAGGVVVLIIMAGFVGRDTLHLMRFLTLMKDSS